MKNEHILYIPEIDISIDDGSGINERNFVKILLDKKVNVLIPRPVNKDVLKDLHNHENLHFTWYLNRRNPFSYIFHVFRKIIDINKINKSKNPAIVVFRLGLIPLDVFFAKRILKKRTFLKHLTFLGSSQKKSFLLSLTAIIRSKFINKKLIDGCDTPSFMTKQYIEKHYGLTNIHIAKNGTSKSEINNFKKEKNFIYIGRLSRGRNTDNLLETFSKCNKNIDIFGFGEMEGLAKEYSKKFDNINFLGKVTYNELVKILPLYKFGIDLTYVDTEFGKASYSQKIAQYLSFGSNVLVVKCLDNQFIEDNNYGILYDIESDNLAQLINEVEYNDVDVSKIAEYIYAEEIVESLLQFWRK